MAQAERGPLNVVEDAGWMEQIAIAPARRTHRRVPAADKAVPAYQEHADVGTRRGGAGLRC